MVQYIFASFFESLSDLAKVVAFHSIQISRLVLPELLKEFFLALIEA